MKKEKESMKEIVKKFITYTSQQELSSDFKVLFLTVAHQYLILK